MATFCATRPGDVSDTDLLPRPEVEDASFHPDGSRGRHKTGHGVADEGEVARRIQVPKMDGIAGQAPA